MKHKVLLADDNESELSALKELFEAEGYEVDTAENGLFAREMVKEKEYDLIVTDLVMPVSDGIQFLYSIGDRGRTIPVIVLTGYNRLDNMLNAYQMGAVDILYKPYDVSQLLELCAKVLKK